MLEGVQPQSGESNGKNMHNDMEAGLNEERSRLDSVTIVRKPDQILCMRNVARDLVYLDSNPEKGPIMGLSLLFFVACLCGHQVPISTRCTNIEVTLNPKP